jgi:ATP-binding cassette subfamily C protein
MELVFLFTALHGSRLVPVLALLLIAAGTELLGLAALLPVASSLFEPGSQHAGMAWRILMLMGFIDPYPSLFLALVAAAMCIRGGALFLAQQLVASSSTALEAQLAKDVVGSALAARWSYLARVGPDKLLDTASRMASEAGMAGPIFAQFLTGGALAVIFVGAVAYISVPTLVAALFIGAPLAAILKVTSGTTMRAASGLTPTQQLRNRLAIDLLVNAKFFKVGVGLDAQLERFNDVVHSARTLNRRVLRGHALMLTVPDTLVAIGVTSLIAIVYGFGFDGGTNFMLALMLMYRAFHYLNQTLSAAHGLARYLPSFAQAQEFIREAGTHRELQDRGGSQMKFQDSIRFESVSFFYEGNQPVLRDWSAAIRKGETLLLKGPSGAGKTTVLDLLTGLLAPSAGTIRIDDTVLDETNVCAWRAKIAYIPQDPPIFVGTVRSNLCMGGPNRSDEALWGALKTAHLEGTVRSRPHGLDTEIGERGLALSGGQRQRLVLARALLTDAELIVLDEPTSAVDPAREALVFASIFKDLRGRKTLVMAVHRFELDPAIGRTIEIRPAAPIAGSSG